MDMDMELARELLNDVIETWHRTGNIGLVEVSFWEIIDEILEK